MKKEWEVTVLSNLITLTPGTLVVDVLENGNERVLYIHAIHVPNVEEAVDGIKNTFEKAILGGESIKMFDIALYIVMVLLALAMVGFIYRLIKGAIHP